MMFRSFLGLGMLNLNLNSKYGFAGLLSHKRSYNSILRFPNPERANLRRSLNMALLLQELTVHLKSDKGKSNDGGSEDNAKKSKEPDATQDAEQYK